MSTAPLASRVLAGIRGRADRYVTVARRRLGLAPHVRGEDRVYWEERGRRYRSEVAEILNPQDPYDLAQREFIARLAGFEWASILEVGCGFGWHLAAIHRASVGRCVVGLDFSFEQLREARRFLESTTVRVLQADAGCLPFADRAFDVVFTSGMLMYIHPTQIVTMLCELRRVSRDRVIVLEPATEHMQSTARRQIVRRAGWHCHAFTKAMPAAGLPLIDGFEFQAFRSLPERTSLSYFEASVTTRGE